MADATDDGPEDRLAISVAAALENRDKRQIMIRSGGSVDYAVRTAAVSSAAKVV